MMRRQSSFFSIILSALSSSACLFFLLLLDGASAIRFVPAVSSSSSSSDSYKTQQQRPKVHDDAAPSEGDLLLSNDEQMHLLNPPSLMTEPSSPSTASSSPELASLTKTRRRKAKQRAQLNPKQKKRQRRQQQQQPPPILQNNNIPLFPKETLIASVAKHFQQGVLIRGGKDLHVPRLLKACKHLERVMRQVGQRANANELKHNIQKVEVVYKLAPKNQRETVSQLLQYEKELHIHEPGGVLQDPSAAVGLLWLRRAIEFQQKLYKYTIVPSTSSKKSAEKPSIESTASSTATNRRGGATGVTSIDATAAALKAYRQTLEKHHGWKMQRLYTLALRSTTPSRTEMIRTLSGVSLPSKRSSSSSSRRSSSPEKTDIPIVLTPQQEKLLERDMKQLLNVWKPIIYRWKQLFVALDLEDKRKV